VLAHGHLQSTSPAACRAEVIRRRGQVAALGSLGLSHRMFVEQKLSHRWPDDYLKCVLQFLALDRPSKQAYLPPDFPAKMFHMGEADMETGSALMFMCQLSQDCCHAFAFSADDERGHLLQELRRLLEQRRRGGDLDLVVRLARMALELFGCLIASPSIPCAVLLDEWSTGVY
jgi:hypothetical protein